MATLGNIIFASQGAKSNLKSSDFLRSREPVRQMSGDELRNMAILAFGPPPKKEG